MSDQANAVENEDSEVEVTKDYKFKSVDNSPKEDALPLDDEADDYENSDDESDDIDDSYDDDDDSESEDDEQSINSAEVEIELKDGRKVRVPKEIADGTMMQSDYTKKTQELSEYRRTQMMREEEFNRLAERQQANFSLYSKLAAIDEQLKDYKDIDWVDETVKNPQLAQQHRAYNQQLVNDRQELVKHLEQAESELQTKQVHYMTVNQKQTVEGLKSAIPDYSPDVGKKVAEYAQKTLGVPVESLHAINNGQLPPHMSIPFIAAAHKAMQFDELMSKKKDIVRHKKPLGNTDKIETPRGTKKSKPNIYSKNMTTEQRIKAYRARKKS